LKNIDDNRSKASPEKSKASIVFSKDGFSELLIIKSISVFAALIVSLKSCEKYVQNYI
jgi:hypothetical protein